MNNEIGLHGIDVFNLPVFADADIWSMWPTDKLSDLADDIRENGFDHRYPITIAEVEGVWMLLDGRNRREAARIAGIIPPIIITDIDPKLAVHRSNNQNRDATPGQKAMAFAMVFPNGVRGGDRKTDSFKSLQNDLTQSERNAISRARFVLRNSPMVEGERYPRRCLDVMNGLISLTEAYELAQQDFKDREKKDKEAKEIAAKRADLEARHPDLAALVAEDKLSLSKAIAAAEQADREAAEEAARIQREEDDRLAEEDRAKKQAAKEEAERREARKTSWFHQFSLLLSAESLVANQAQIDLADELKGTWDEFAAKHMFEFKEARRRLRSLHENIPALIQKFEAMKDD
jgi:hypothetical protein